MTFLSALTLLFIALKLTGVIAWSWWFVLMPMLILVFLFIVLLVGAYMTGEKLRFATRRRRPF